MKIATIAISRKLLTRAYHLLTAQAAGTPGAPAQLQDRQEPPNPG